MKNIYFIVLTILSISFSVSAQCSANNFSGTWILSKSSSKNANIGGELKVSISESGQQCTIERNSLKDEFTSNTYRKVISKNNYIIGKLNFKNANKFNITRTSGSPLNIGSRVGESIEYWTISDNGKKLTIETQSRDYTRSSNTADFTTPRYSNPDFSSGTVGIDTGSSYSRSSKHVYVRK